MAFFHFWEFGPFKTAYDEIWPLKFFFDLSTLFLCTWLKLGRAQSCKRRLPQKHLLGHTFQPRMQPIREKKWKWNFTFEMLQIFLNKS